MFAQSGQNKQWPLSVRRSLTNASAGQGRGDGVSVLMRSAECLAGVPRASWSKIHILLWWGKGHEPHDHLHFDLQSSLPLSTSLQRCRFFEDISQKMCLSRKTQLDRWLYLFLSFKKCKVCVRILFSGWKGSDIKAGLQGWISLYRTHYSVHRQRGHQQAEAVNRTALGTECSS